MSRRERRATTATHVALVRGINVGTARRVAMADLRALVTGLGHTGVRTLLNSGNVVFTASRGMRGSHASRIERAMASDLGVPARVIVLTADELATIVEENPLGPEADNPSRVLVIVWATASDRVRLEPLVREDWAPARFAVGSRAAYAWCPDGVLGSALLERVGGALGDAATSRNWNTVTRLHALLGMRS